MMDMQKTFLLSLQGFKQGKVLSGMLSGAQGALSSVTLNKLGLNMDSMNEIKSYMESLNQNPL